MKKHSKPQSIHKVIERLLKIRPRSVGELRHRLLLKGFAPEVVESAIERLKEAGLLDDRAFAAWWIEQRSIIRPTGPYALTMELREKRIGKEIIEEAIARSGVKAQELELAQEALGRRMNRYARLEPETGRRRIASFLARRGFSSGTISAIIRGWEGKRR